jgi:hypothetical protein
MVSPASPKLIALYANRPKEGITEQPEAEERHPGYTHAQMLCRGWSDATARQIIGTCPGCLALHEANLRVH